MGNLPRLKWDIRAFSGDVRRCSVVRLDVDLGEMAWMRSKFFSVDRGRLTLGDEAGEIVVF
jgi:hypothetical protein